MLPSSSQQMHESASVTTSALSLHQQSVTQYFSCENFEPLKAELAEMHREMKQAEAKFYDSLIKANISIERKNAVYHAAGFSVSDFRIKRVGFVPNNLTAFAFEARPEQLSPSLDYQVMLALAKSDYATIIQLVEQGELSQNAMIAGQNILSSLMLHTQLPLKDLQQLLNAGLRVTMADLVFATLTRQDQLVLDTLAHRYDGDLHATFQANGKTYNLVTLSTELLHYPALQLWSGLGVSHDVEADFYSSLDILPVPTNQHEKTQALAVLDFLVKYGVQAHSQHTISRINQWSNHQYQDLLQLSDSFEQLLLDSGMSEERTDYLRQMRKAQTYYYALFDHVNAKQRSCGEVDISQYALFDNGGTATLHDWLVTLPTMNQLSDTDIQALQMALDTQKTVDAGDADSVVALLEKYGSLGGAHPEFDQVLFISMLNQHANTEQLIQLAQYAPIPDYAIFMLIAQQRIDAIPNLIPYGLNMDTTDPQGQTPLQFANQVGLSFDKIMQLSDALNLSAQSQ
ncbi:hypothetical protein Q3O60_03285 [Alkalimonas collagenimarina]|uniref:Ankyrin repeat domain-containing protein n=1 Tax=Alkalimonas collagenimarina TaxID=400390 RepID=A0ABT9GVZ5_9GAMM|nr:hypothetical protein [Alkalimonas collagenimarina]MDP4535211.1 hypothetical protein [Alkalimonas collagenimarina]